MPTAWQTGPVPETASTSLPVFISMVHRTILPRDHLLCSGSFMRYLKAKWDDHSTTSFGDLSQCKIHTEIQNCHWPFWRHFLSSSGQVTGLWRSAAAKVSYPCPSMGGRQDWICEASYRPWSLGNTLSRLISTCLPHSVSWHLHLLTPIATDHMDIYNTHPARPYHGQRCPAQTLGISPDFPYNKKPHS